MQKLTINLDLSNTSYLDYKDEHIYKKEMFIFDNLLTLISSISSHRQFSLIKKLAKNPNNADKIDEESFYIQNKISPILNKFTYFFNNDEKNIILISQIDDSIDIDELKDIFSYIKKHIDFNIQHLDKKEIDDEHFFNVLVKKYNDDIIIYERIINSLILN